MLCSPDQRQCICIYISNDSRVHHEQTNIKFNLEPIEILTNIQLLISGGSNFLWEMFSGLLG